VTTAVIKLPSFQKRILLVVPAILLCVFAFFVVRWSFAQSVAEQAETKELADFAAGLAPNLPQPHYALAAISEKAFSPEDDVAALREYELAAALSPHDWRSWLALGRMRERTGDSEAAEKAVRKAAELAPAYAQIRWTLGNMLLRRGEIEPAFVELRAAAAQNPIYAPPTVDAAMQIFAGETVDAILRRAGDTPAARAATIKFLAKDGKFDQALQIWNGFSEEEKIANKDDGKSLFHSLIEGKKFRLAQTLYIELPETEDAGKIGVGAISNPDFESDRISSPANPLPFAWFVSDGNEPTIAFDAATKRGGERSLQLAFRTVTAQDLRQIYQTVTVESGARYRLEFYAKTAGLKTSATVRWDVEDAADGKILASSPVVATGDTDWQKLTVDFTAAPKTEAVNIRLARAACILSPCALVGRIWFDDFGLQKINQP
jgi:tetratricopeptide (TPR) repeat protein